MPRSLVTTRAGSARAPGAALRVGKNAAPRRWRPTGIAGANGAGAVLLLPRRMPRRPTSWTAAGACAARGAPRERPVAADRAGPHLRGRRVSASAAAAAAGEAQHSARAARARFVRGALGARPGCAGCGRPLRRRRGCRGGGALCPRAHRRGRGRGAWWGVGRWAQQRLRAAPDCEGGGWGGGGGAGRPRPHGGRPAPRSVPGTVSCGT